ncbi:ATP-binding protein [Herbaspirillum sp. YR522]|uniref:ATP-binding protein n=1 Tax=Herbaspirillum sp. YR522 TaxID=1144342 RepID=UPI00026FBBEC|nr:ATP-binding protein [Herbaspirillum sp. YR522]EJN08685.1 PAS domain S-box [Herbaspirillum sp. YR522]
MAEQDSKISWLSGGGEMGKLIRSMDWSDSPLGPIDQWPQSLRTAVSLCLSSTFPILIAWGPHDIQIYNDAYRPICGAKHPQSMGEDFKICWATALPVVGDAFDRAHQGEGTYIRDQRMFLDRYGYLEEAFMTFSFSPIRVESGEVGGVFHPISESTDKVLGARRTSCLRDLAAGLAKCLSIDELCQGLVQRHESLSLDVPFTLFYQLQGDTLQRRGVAGLAAVAPMAPDSVALDGVGGWPFAAAMQARAIIQVPDLAERFGTVAAGPYPEAPVQAVILPVMAAGSELPFGFLVAGVSARRALDAEYLDFYALLGNAVSTAVTNVLVYLHEQRKAEELAEIDCAKTAFFSNISHEFRTPLTLMVGPLDDALADTSEPLGPAQRVRLQVTHRNSQRLLKLVNALLDFSRIEAGRARASFVATDLAALTEDLASVFRSTIEKAGLAFEVDIAELGEPVFVDRDMWEKVVFNLLSNAFKFTFAGKIRVTLERVGELARLVVADTGSGIAAEELPRVFERFHRIENAQGRTYEGTGIGLALIQELVKLHHGQIGATSTPGQGSRFHVEIPLGSAHLKQAEIAGLDTVAVSKDAQPGIAFIQEAQAWLPDAQPGAIEAVDEPPLSSLSPLSLAGQAHPVHIVIADDNRDMREYLKRLLQSYATVQACADGQAAYAAVCAAPPDLVLSDVMMPVLDGFGLLARIKSNDATRDVPVILLSARAGEEAKIEGIQAGADDYLVKPFAANELLSRIKGQVDASRRRRAARAALELSEQYFRSLVDASTAIIWTTDQAGRTTYLSRRWYDFSGQQAGPDPDAGWVASVHPDERQRAGQDIAAWRDAGVAFHQVYRLRHASGAYRWAAVSGTPLFDEAGQGVGFVGSIIDVHDEREAKRTLEILADDLALVNQRQNEFLVTLAHELRNPLAPIRNGLEVIKMLGSDNERQRGIHQMMERQVRHLGHLVEDLLDIARITEGKIKLQKQQVSMKEAFSDAVEISMPLIEKNQHKLIVEVPDPTLVIDADPNRITQVISNILNNAAKYTPPGGKIVVASHADGDYAVITVTDNGIGLSAEHITSVFSMFAQVQAEVDRAQGGLGIGLHLVKRLVDLHGGEVSVASEGLGQGCRFSVRLPRVHQQRPGGRAGAPVPSGRARVLDILIVDDNVDSAEMLSMLMDYHGHAARIAASGRQALEIAAASRPDVVFLDIGLPDMSGYEVAAALRKIPGLDHARFVALTGRGAETDKASALAAGFDHHVTKPASLERLLEILAGVGRG